jgi:hypothetical protein
MPMTQPGRVAPSRVVICLTSIAGNSRELLETLRSLLEQTAAPDEIRLYLSEEGYLQDGGFAARRLPAELERLLADSPLVHVFWTENIGPYRKLLPALRTFWDTDTILITVDDDTVYAPEFVEKMLTLWDRHHCCISFRATHICESWRYEDYEQRPGRSLGQFHKGKGGVLFHARHFSKTPQVLQNDFLSLAPTGDDVWWNLFRIANGVECWFEPWQYMLRDNTNQRALCFVYNGPNQNRRNDEMIAGVRLFLEQKGLMPAPGALSSG